MLASGNDMEQRGRWSRYKKKSKKSLGIKFARELSKIFERIQNNQTVEREQNGNNFTRQ